MNPSSTLTPAYRIRHFWWYRFMPAFFGFYAGCMSCHLLRTLVGTDAVTGAALAGFAGTFIPLPKRTDKVGIRAAIYSGAFVGMCSANVIAAPLEVPVVSLVGAVFYIALTPFFQGLGGKLGAIAFATTATILMLKTLA